MSAVAELCEDCRLPRGRAAPARFCALCARKRKRADDAARRAAYAAAGVCAKCGERDARPGRKSCRACVIADRDRYRRDRGGLARPDRGRCGACRELGHRRVNCDRAQASVGGPS